MAILSRHRNLTLLAVVLFLQVLGLAVQVKRPTARGPVRLIRVWGIGLITPAENAVEHAQEWFHDTWRNYFYLRDVRRENERLHSENIKLRLEQVRVLQDASQAQRLQALFKFKEQFISDTIAAQVIGSSGSEQSRILYIDKGTQDGIKSDMAVITPTGIVGKVMRVFPTTAQVLEINDQSSGVGAILEKSRLQGILKGTPAGETVLHYVMTEEKVEIGELVLTSGGDRIFPKGLPIGQVTQVNPGADTFLNIRVKAAAQLDRVEEVLVITRVVEKEPENVPATGPMRASDILAQRLPSVPVKPPDPTKLADANGAAGASPTASAPVPGAKPLVPGTSVAKPTTTATTTPKPVTAAAPGAKSLPSAGPGNKAAATGTGTQPTAKPATQGAGNKPATTAAPKPAEAKPAAVGPVVKSASATSGMTGGASAAVKKIDDKVKKPVAQNAASAATKGNQ